MLIYVEWEAGSQKSEDGRCKKGARLLTTDPQMCCTNIIFGTNIVFRMKSILL